MEFTVQDFLCDNWALLGILAGVMLVSQLIVHMDKRMVFLMRLSVLLLVLLAVADYLEVWTAYFPSYTVWRGLLSALGYTLRPLILLSLVAMVAGRQKPIVNLPALLNGLICFASIYTGWVFRFTAENEWSRGPLGFVPFVAGFFYLGLLILRTSRIFRRAQDESRAVYLFIAAFGSLTLLIAIALDRHDIFNVSYGVDMLIYYLFLHVELTKRDALTKLLNRQSYYFDTDRGEAITGALSVDMNELKWINDHEGHQAGDAALTAISDCFFRCIGKEEHAYRVGGDEFFILTRSKDEKRLAELERKLRAELDKVGYSCSMGAALRLPGEDPEALCNRADEEMYRDKAQYYSTVGRDRRRR